MDSLLVFIACIAIAVIGAWDSARHRHNSTMRHKRRRTGHA